MDSCLYYCKSALKTAAAFSLLFSTLVFASPSTATPREAGVTLNKAAPMQLAYYRWHRYHRYHPGWHRYHRYHHYHRWHHWRR